MLRWWSSSFGSYQHACPILCMLSCIIGTCWWWSFRDESLRVETVRLGVATTFATADGRQQSASNDIIDGNTCNTHKHLTLSINCERGMQT